MCGLVCAGAGEGAGQTAQVARCAAQAAGGRDVVTCGGGEQAADMSRGAAPQGAGNYIRHNVIKILCFLHVKK